MSEKYQQDVKYVEENVSKLLAEFNTVLKNHGLDLQLEHFGLMSQESLSLFAVESAACRWECWDCKDSRGRPTRCCGMRCDT